MSETKTLSREQFVYGAAKDQLHEFSVWWQSAHVLDPEKFPKWMDEAAWYENFMRWRKYRHRAD